MNDTFSKSWALSLTKPWPIIGGFLLVLALMSNDEHFENKFLTLLWWSKRGIKADLGLILLLHFPGFEIFSLVIECFGIDGVVDILFNIGVVSSVLEPYQNSDFDVVITGAGSLKIWKKQKSNLTSEWVWRARNSWGWKASIRWNVSTQKCVETSK